MSAVITLLGSIVIAIFFIGPSLVARFAVESFIVKQPSRSQSSTEELARALIFSIPLVGLASFLVWLRFHHQHTFDPGLAVSLFAEGASSAERTEAMRSLWPVRSVLVTTYALDGIYFCLVYTAASLLSRPGFRFLYPVCNLLVAPYAKSYWDMLITGIGLPLNTIIYADVATKSGKIYMGRLEDARTGSDGTLVHLQLSDPRMRGDDNLTPQRQDYVFHDSYFFVIPAAEIANVNLRFATSSMPDAERHEAASPVAAPSSPTQPLREPYLDDALKGLDDETRRSLSAELEKHDSPAPSASKD